MPILSVTLKNHTVIRIDFASGSNLFDLLNSQERTKVRSACQKNGTCGLCLVRIDEGEVSALTEHEQQRLTTRQVAQSIRLACQVQVLDDVSIRLINPLLIKALDKLPVSSPLANGRYSIAVDLGSTQIRFSLWDTVNQQRIAIYCCFNPQAYYGIDILSRLFAAVNSEKALQAMSKLILTTINRVVTDWRDNKNLPIDNILIVGNTVMLALLAKKHCEHLLQPEYWAHPLDCALDINRLGNIPVAIVQPLVGFVGSDLLVGVLFSRLTQQTGSALFIDFGTNSEIALWYSGILWITSVPGGPAFEGSGISCGVAAEIGAVSHITYNENNCEFNGSLIGDNGQDIKGLCGSALCDLIACLLTTGQLKKNGRFSQPVQELEIHLVNLNYCFILKKSDVDVFQRAKAATGAGITGLMNTAGASITDITRLCIAGAFGQFLTVSSAQTIGLLPDCTAEKIELCGNTALMGCEQLLGSDVEAQLSSLRQAVHSLNMAQLDGYEELFIDNLYLRPIPLLCNATYPTKVSPC